MVRLLLTGFEPFGGEAVNPSGLLAERLAQEGCAGAEIATRILPVVRYRCIDLVVNAIEEWRPDVVIMLGQAGTRPWITPERIAINLDDYRSPDNAGNQPIDEPIVPGGPAAYFSTLPVRAMVQRMTDAGVPAAISNTAGTYLCNHVCYGVLHYLALRRLPVRAGFIHLPYLPQQAVGKAIQAPALGMETMLCGLRAAVTAALGSAAPALATV